MFPGNPTDDSLPKTNALQSTKHIVLESYTDGIVLVHRAVMKQVHTVELAN